MKESCKIARKSRISGCKLLQLCVEKEIRRFPIQIQSLREKRKRKVKKVPYLTYRRSFYLSLWQSSLVTIIVMGLLLYHRFKLALEKTAVDNTEATVEGTVEPVKCRSAGYSPDL